MHLNRLSLSREFLYFAIIVVSLVFFSLAWVFWYGYRDLIETREKNYINVSKSIEQTLLDSFQQVNYFTEYFANEIKYSKEFNDITINNIFNSKLEVNKLKDDIVPWTMFEFINANNMVIVKTASSTYKQIEITPLKRQWMKTAREKPWKLHITDPDIGIVSGEYIIPGGYGITRDNGDFLGIISVGFDTNKLKRKLERTINFGDTYYAILNNNYKLITSSKTDHVHKFLEIFKNLSSLEMLKKQIADKNLVQDDIIYEAFRFVKPYDFIILVGSKKSDIKAKLGRFIIPQVTKSIVLTISFLILLYFFGIKIVKPIQKLSNYAIEISEANFDCKAPQTNSVETANLLKAIDMVKVSLQNEFAIQNQLADINQKMQMLNFELEEKVRSRTIDLEKALAAKTEFLNNISHEIRTPIHGFTSISQGIVEHWHSFSDSKKLELSKHVANSAKRLADIINNLLDLSKFTANKMTFDVQFNDFNAVIEDSINEFKTFNFSQKNINIDFISNIDFQIYFDKNRISQVFRNLLTNAAKFSEENSLITIKCDSCFENSTKFLLCSVVDQGLGIPEDEIDLIFTAFSQSSRTKNFLGGTGLGLSICKEIIEAHQGRIWVENNLDKGCTFKFIIPI